MRVRLLASAAAIGLVGMLLLSGCSSSDNLASAYGSGSGTNYTDDSGVPVLVKEANRAKPVNFSSTTEDGMPLKASDYRGKVVVVNFWYASCAPCRAEAPILQNLYDTYQQKGVSFIGVNIFDQPAAALAFEKEHNVTYPSVMDVDSGAVRIAFAGAVSPTATPTTFVLDKKGRIAARIVGELQSTSILNTLISDTLAEGN
ncbi:MAG: alkyl hydroperoxide reductase [Microbacteriaceae bacterium]|nr:alkyl hydroperoxide reductase [Microbacteriaceae bacterium]